LRIFITLYCLSAEVYWEDGFVCTCRFSWIDELPCDNCDIPPLITAWCEGLGWWMPVDRALALV